MLRRKIMAVLSEEGSECIGNPIQTQKYENLDNLPKNGPNGGHSWTRVSH